ncbi:MAG: FAD-dependent oxidoreductase, partial [Clostridiales Family XIII bacterium]|nr:FAD-dependent oxidoreductase [Clostridiales Family XIII bacterium]
GDAAGFVINMGYSFRGMDFAVESGRLAAQSVVEAKRTGDYSTASLSRYRRLLDESFVTRDLKHYEDYPRIMDQGMIYNELPRLAEDFLSELFTVDGTGLRGVGRVAFDSARQAGSLTDFARLVWRSRGAL